MGSEMCIRDSLHIEETMFIKKYLKWISTALVLTGILLTNLNIYPINIYFHGLGVIGWTIAGFISKDKAILTNFGLQIPLFLIGFYQLLFLDAKRIKLLKLT